MAYQDQEPDKRSAGEKIVAELLSEARKAKKIDLERADAMTALITKPEWAVYVELLTPRIQNFADQLMAPLSTMDATLGQEYLKGAMSGLIIARDLPAVIIAAMKELRPAKDEDDEQ